LLQCGVAPQKRLDIGNYACALLFPVRLALKQIYAVFVRLCVSRWTISKKHPKTIKGF